MNIKENITEESSIEIMMGHQVVSPAQIQNDLIGEEDEYDQDFDDENENENDMAEQIRAQNMVYKKGQKPKN